MPPLGSLSESLVAAVAKEIRQRAAVIDGNSDRLISIGITVKLQAGGAIRCVVYEDQTQVAGRAGGSR